MKRILILMMLVLFCSCGCKLGANELQNYSFEDCDTVMGDCDPDNPAYPPAPASDKFFYWTANNMLGLGDYIDQNTTTAGIPDGIACMEMHGSSGGFDNPATRQDITLAASKVYLLVYHGKSDGGSSKISLQDLTTLKYLQDDGSWNAASNRIDALNIETTDTSWTTKWILFTSDSAGSYRLYIIEDTDSQSVFVDNITVQEILLNESPKTSMRLTTNGEYSGEN